MTFGPGVHFAGKNVQEMVSGTVVLKKGWSLFKGGGLSLLQCSIYGWNSSCICICQSLCISTLWRGGGGAGKHNKPVLACKNRFSF